MDIEVFKKVAETIRGWHPGETLIALGVLGFVVILSGGINDEAFARTWALAVSGGLVAIGAIVRAVQDIVIASFAKSAFSEFNKGVVKGIEAQKSGLDELMKLLGKTIGTSTK